MTSPSGMVLKGIRLSRFKAFEAADLDIAPVTVLIGPNNAGKSSVLHALALLGQSVEANGLEASGLSVDLGQDLMGLVHGWPGSPGSRPHNNRWSVSLRWEDPVRLLLSGAPVASNLIDFSVEAGGLPFQARSTAAVTTESSAGRRVVVTASYDPSAQPPTDHASLEAPELRSLEEHQERVSQSTVVTAHNLWSLFVHAPEGENLLEIGEAELTSTAERARVGDPKAVALYGWATAAGYFRHRIAQALTVFRYVGPDRHVSQSVFPLGNTTTLYPSTARQITDILAYNKDALQQVSARCLSVFGYGIAVDLVPDKQVTLVAVSPDAARRNIVNMGSGLVQLVWIVLQMELARIRAGDGGFAPTIGIEEPELHLHPAKQPEMARVITDFAREGATVICTTQSEHFLMALLESVLDKSLDPPALAVYYVDEGHAERLDVDEQGRLSGGLRGFFEANEAQLSRHIELISRRA